MTAIQSAFPNRRSICRPTQHQTRILYILTMAFVVIVILYNSTSILQARSGLTGRHTDQPRLMPATIMYELAKRDLKNPRKTWPRVVVSLSSFPGRVQRVNTTLNSLFEQSLVPDIVYLALPDHAERLKDTVPETTGPPPQFILDLESERPVTKGQRGAFKLIRTMDYGPSTKLLPALLEEQDPDTIIITVDDDVVYHPDMVLLLVAFLQRAKAEGAKVAPCWDCEVWSAVSGSPYRPDKEGVCEGWLGAYAGAAYYRSYFPTDAVFDYTHAPAGCKLHDDVWISGTLWASHGVRPYIVRPGWGSVLSHGSWDHMAIHSVKDTESGYRDPCIKHFNGLA